MILDSRLTSLDVNLKDDGKFRNISMFLYSCMFAKRFTYNDFVSNDTQVQLVLIPERSMVVHKLLL